MSNGLIAVGSNGLAIQSFNGLTWIVQTTPVSSILRDVHYAQGKYVAVGDGGVILTSLDGVSWSLQTSGTAQKLHKIFFSNNLWVVAGNGIVLRSADAITWFNVASPFSPAIDSGGITRNLTTYVLVVAGGGIATSPDAITWTIQTSGTAEDLKAVEYVGFLGLFIAAGNNGTVRTSPTGVTWTAQTSNTSSDLQTIIVDSDNNRLVAVGENGTILLSIDGVTWTPQATPHTDQHEDGWYEHGLYVLVGATAPSSVQKVATSLNGADWTLQSGIGTDELLGVGGTILPGAAFGPSGEGWGKDSWGVDPWGSALPQAPLVIANAVAISTKELQITLNRSAQVIAPTVAGDALNPATWVIQRLDTGFFFSVLAVVQTDEFEFVLSMLQDFGSVSVTHRVLSDTLLDSDGGPISQPPLNRADFLGLLSTERKDALATARLQSNAVRDVSNPPLPASNVGGTLVIGSNGDYALESGPILLKKLIIRRLLTTPGGFAHLPDYGVGIGVKEVLPAANMIQLRAEVLRQIRREREVEDVSVRLELGIQNDLTIQVKAKTNTGEDVSFSFSPQAGGVVL